MDDKIKVVIRVRPLIAREIRSKQKIHWTVRGNTITQINPTTGAALRAGYTFDHVFDTNVLNQEIFNMVARRLVLSAIEGFNTTIFAYGQTSSGKTHTMLGSGEDPGIIPLAISEMFDEMQRSAKQKFLVRASYMEIYNEKINDLLSNQHDLRLNAEKGKVVVAGLKEVLVTATEEVLNLMAIGQENRKIGETNMNERSSRSHTIFRLIIESCGSEKNVDIVKVSHLNMVDLAGSERTDSKIGSERFHEGKCINLSLLTLGLVISQLSEGLPYASFRNSVLTRILEPALGGNSLTTIVCNVTPATVDLTNNTLSFASRAKKIKTDARVNEVISQGTLLKQYERELAELKEELQKAKSRDVVQEMESKLLEQERMNTVLRQRIDLLSKLLIGPSASQTVADGSEARKGPQRRQTWGGTDLCMLPAFQQLVAVSESPVPILPKQARKSPAEDGVCRCKDLENEVIHLAQEALSGRSKTTQLQEEVENQAKLIESINSELKAAQRKVHVYQSELKNMQLANLTPTQINQSRVCSDAAIQTDDVRMFIQFGSGVITHNLLEELRMTVINEIKKYETLKTLYCVQKEKLRVSENKVTELKGEKKIYCNAQVQTEDPQSETLSNKEVQVDTTTSESGQYESAQSLFLKSRTAQLLDEKNILKSLCDSLSDQVKELEKNPQRLAFWNLSYILQDESVVCNAYPKPASSADKKNENFS